jgi:hypothetical protein
MYFERASLVRINKTKYGTSNPIASNNNPISVYRGLTVSKIKGKTARKVDPAQGREIME